MRAVWIALFVLCFSPSLAAKPGPYITLGFGPTSASGESVPQSQINNIAFDPTFPDPLTTQIDGGLSGLVRVGFNILGYAAPEINVTGHGKDLGSTDREWAAHWHAGVRAYPLWHWRHIMSRLPEYLAPLEPSVFIGFGQSFQGYNVVRGSTNGDVAWQGFSSWRYGLGAEYYLSRYFKVGLDYNVISAAYDTFIFDLDSSTDGEVDPKAKTSFQQLYLSASFHWVLGDD